MKRPVLLVLAVLALFLAACAPAAYVPRDLASNAGQALASNEPGRLIPPAVGDETISGPGFVVPPRRPVPPPADGGPVICAPPCGTPPTPPVVDPPPPADETDCKVRDLRRVRVVKCPGDPARVERP